LFQIQSYYIDTRGYDIENFWNKESDLFVSAVRPVARFIPGLELHRLSSVFLEPVTLGNYCATVTAFLCACFNRLSRTAFFYLAITNVVALVGCDGRLALIATVPMVAAAMSARHLPRYSSFVYLPTFIALAVAVTYLGGFVGGQDDIMGRLAYSRELLARFDAVELLGISNRFLSEAVDSGIAYLTITQSMFGALAMWLFITLGSDESTLEEKRYKHAISLYFALALLVSFSIFSIKTGALMWFTFGSLQRANETN
jgi:putative polymerase